MIFKSVIVDGGDNIRNRSKLEHGLETNLNMKASHFLTTKNNTTVLYIKDKRKKLKPHIKGE